VAAAGQYAYVANGSDGLRIYNVSNPANPMSIGNTNNSSNGGSAQGLALVGNYLYLANAGDGMRVYDVSTPSNPANVGYASNPNFLGAAFGVAVSGGYAYLANGSDGLRVYAVPFVTTLPPQLGISLAGANSALISWPAAATGFALQQNANLGTTNWSAVTNVPSVVGGQNQVVISPLTGNRVFRLISQ
jgi:hypothetical protein